MPKFIKILLRGMAGDGDETQWRILIDNLKDLNTYHSLDASLNMEAFMKIGEDRNYDTDWSKEDWSKEDSEALLSPRAVSIQRLLKSKVASTPYGDKVFPIIEVANITDQKYLAMLRGLQRGTIQVNQAGGWSDLDSFLLTWNGEILEEVEKKTFGFPTDDEVIKADTIILENGSPDTARVYIESEEDVAKDIKDAGVIKTIYNLKERDIDYVVKCIMAAKNVVIESQLRDINQVDMFMELFSKIPRKNIYLYISKDDEPIIKGSPLFETNNAIHSIQIIN